MAFDKGYFEELLKKEAASKRQPEDGVKIIQDKIKDLDHQIDRLMDLYQKDTMPLEMVSERIETLYQQKVALTKQLDTTKPEKLSNFDYEGVLSILSDIPLVWDYADMEQKRFLMRSLIDRIVIAGEDYSVEWSFLPKD